MADFKGRKKGKSHVQNMRIFFCGSGHGLEPSCQISSYYKFFRVKAISTGLQVGVDKSLAFKKVIVLMQLMIC